MVGRDDRWAEKGVSRVSVTRTFLVLVMSFLVLPECIRLQQQAEETEDLFYPIYVHFFHTMSKSCRFSFNIYLLSHHRKGMFFIKRNLNSIRLIKSSFEIEPTILEEKFL